MPDNKSEKERKPRKQHDELLKGVFEEWFREFLCFLYPNAEEIFDFSGGLVFMDKELYGIIPERMRTKGLCVADLLTRVRLREGEERWLLLHTEIEGGNSNDFGFRMFRYYYRLLDRYRVPVESIAIFTGGRSQQTSSCCHYHGIVAGIHFRYLCYHIFDHTEGELLAMDNAFALIVLACQKALSEGQVSDRQLGEYRLVIARALLKQMYDYNRIISFVVFLKNFLYVEDEEINRVFDEQILKLTGGKIDMAVIDIVKAHAREDGFLEGAEKARACAKADMLRAALKMKQSGFNTDLIAHILELPVAEVEAL